MKPQNDNEAPQRPDAQDLILDFATITSSDGHRGIALFTEGGVIIHYDNGVFIIF